MLTSEELINHKIGVIAVAGKYRTGKSFLLNRILLNKKGDKTGFGVGPTINPCTKVSFITNYYKNKYILLNIIFKFYLIKKTY